MAKPRISPGRWDPPPAPALTGRYAPNDVLEHVEIWPVPGTGPEDVVVDSVGRIYTGLLDGRIVRFPAGGGAPEIIVNTGGRPLGIEVLEDDTLIVCDAHLGVLHVDPEAPTFNVVVNDFGGDFLRFTNNAAVAADGRVYFTDSSTRFGFDHYMADVFEHQGNGRLLLWEPERGEVQILASGLYFPNGVALAPDESFLLYAETVRYRVSRLWLTGDRAGETEPFMENLPGLPDNLSCGPDGTFWIALVNPRDTKLDRLLRMPRLRQMVWRLPDALRPGPSRVGFVLGVDAGARVVYNLQSPDGEPYAAITGVREHDGWLYLGSLEESAIARVRLPGKS